MPQRSGAAGNNPPWNTVALVNARRTRRWTAAAFSEQTMLRPLQARPERGWRRAVYEASGGRINPGPSSRERRERALIARVAAPTSGCRRVAVLSRKGGCGKTTSALMLGHTFASLRGDRVIAVDGNPDAGSLGYRVRRETDATLSDLLQVKPASYPDLRRLTSQAPSRLEVLASDDDPRISEGLGPDAYAAALGLLAVHYTLVVIDTGTGILHGGIQGILDSVEQLVVVVAPSLDGARGAAQTLDWLDQHGHSALVRESVAVLNRVDAAGRLRLDRIALHFAARCRAVVRVPEDPRLRAGGEASLDHLRPRTRSAYVELAAAVADGFAGALNQGRHS